MGAYQVPTEPVNDVSSLPLPGIFTAKCSSCSYSGQSLASSSRTTRICHPPPTSDAQSCSDFLLKALKAGQGGEKGCYEHITSAEQQKPNLPFKATGALSERTNEKKKIIKYFKGSGIFHAKRRQHVLKLIKSLLVLFHSARSPQDWH